MFVNKNKTINVFHHKLDIDELDNLLQNNSTNKVIELLVVTRK